MKLLLTFLTCADQKEADTIAAALLQKRLIACAKMMPISSTFMWEGTVQSSHEILLMMETEESKFSLIEQEVKKLHSYNQFVLTATPTVHASAGVAEWIADSIK
jgi:periplasmic divalent cation tolerance protein